MSAMLLALVVTSVTLFTLCYVIAADQPFFEMWRTNVSASLPEPFDVRWKDVTVQQMLDHVSGITNGEAQ
jgi:hypothetical protein